MPDLSLSISPAFYEVLQAEASQRGLTVEKLAEKVLKHYIVDYDRTFNPQDNAIILNGDLVTDSAQPDLEAAVETATVARESILKQLNLARQRYESADDQNKASHEQAVTFWEIKLKEWSSSGRKEQDESHGCTNIVAHEFGAEFRAQEEFIPELSIVGGI